MSSCLLAGFAVHCSTARENRFPHKARLATFPEHFVQSVFSVGLLLILCSSVCPTGHALTIADDRFTSCEPADKFIELKVTSKTIAATGTTPERRVWVLTEFPTDSQIQVAPGDTILKNKILEILQQIRDTTPEVGVGKAGDPEDGDPLQLEAFLLADLDSVRPGLELKMPPELTSPPQVSDQGQMHTVRICLDYIPPLPPGSVEINIKTLGGADSPLTEIPSLTLADAAERFRGRSEGAIPVRIAYAQQDLEDARKDGSVTTEAVARDSVQRELLKVAAASFDLAVAAGLLGPDGKPLVDRSSGQAIAIAVQREIVGLYSLNNFDPKIEWGGVASNVGVRDATPGAPWIIVVSGLQLAQRVDIEVIKSPIESEFDGSASEKKLLAKREKVRDKLRAEHLARFSARPGHLITSKDIKLDLEQLDRDKGTVKSVSDPTSGPAPADSTVTPQDLIYNVSRHMKAEQILSLKLGGAYSPEEHFAGSAGIEEINLIGFSETAKLDYSGGPQVQKIRFNFDVPFESSETSGWHLKTFTINVQYFADKDMRFGNLTKDEIEAREAGSEARLSLGYDSFSVLDHAAAECLTEKRKRTRFYLNATPSLGFRDVNLKEDDLLLTITRIDKSLLPRARTQTTTLSLDGNLGFSHDFRQQKTAGLGMLNVSLKGRLQRGSRFFGGDYHYNKVYATLSSEIFFGFISSKDLFLRHNRVMGTGTRGIPIFELFRLGGPQSVRGMEEGELIGRKLSADQIELGINTMVVWHLITGKPVADALLKDKCSEDAEPSPLPFDINSTYIKVFYDRGRIHDRDSFVVPGTQNRVAQGYGIAVEIRELGGKNINLSFGYARSPESTLHKSGALYTGVSYSF